MAFEWLSDIGKALDITGGDVLRAGAGIAGGLINQSATNRAADAQSAAGDKALELQERMYQQSRTDLAPYRASGEAANAKPSQLMWLAPPDSSAIRGNLMTKYPLLFGGIGAAGNPEDIYKASGDVLSGVQGINSGSYKYNQADFQRIIDAAGQPNYADYTRQDVISAAQRLADPNSQTKTADAQFLVDKFNRLHSQFDPKPKKKKRGLSGFLKMAVPAAIGLGVGAAIPGIGGAIAGKVASTGASAALKG